MPSIKGVTLEQVKREYYRAKAIPTTMAQVADVVGLDYLEMMDFIRESAPDFEFHVLTQTQMERMKLPMSQKAEYLLDYYLGAESSMVSMAIIFDYSTNKAIRRTMLESKTYKERVKGKKRYPRERMIDCSVAAPAATMPTRLTVEEINKAALQFCEAKLPVFTEWAKVGIKYYSFYPPIYKKMANLAIERNVSMDDLIASVILKCYLGAKK